MLRVCALHALAGVRAWQSSLTVWLTVLKYLAVIFVGVDIVSGGLFFPCSQVIFGC